MPDYLHRAEPAYGSMARDEPALDEELAAERPIFKPMRLRARDVKNRAESPDTRTQTAQRKRASFYIK